MYLRLRRKKGYALIFICILMPIIIAIMGLCVDVGVILYYEARLMSATKFAALSASSNYVVVNKKIMIVEDQQAFVNNVLTTNFSDAQLVSFKVSGPKKEKYKCTVTTKTEVPLFFVGAIGLQKSKEIKEQYVAERRLK